ncbi:putative WRKY transcription factor 3 [Apostasia shenzhenica]|uniref:Putative WRKY transcription factor 3 n=1 Tax=Apostasia shenzhenica TaxID=1088818 RepID=A0A2I0APB9_9ASPA|nr:putative WRKY transcription factor 3 [Apostasia shenzhenica]
MPNPTADGGARGPAAPDAEAKRPFISLPPRSAVEGLFRGGAVEASPGPMTLSSFFAEDPESECRSFSQLLAGAMASPTAAARAAPADARAGGLNLGHSRPMNLQVGPSPFFTVPAGLSPGGLLDSPAMFSSNLGHFGMSHQQALAQVSAQAAYSHSSSSLNQPILTVNMATDQPKNSITLNTNTSITDQRSQPAALVVEKPADDGYNWRKYGQKQVKGSEYPRSYYKCTHLKCPVKKKVERSLDGQVTEIIYKGQHNHQQPPANKRAKEGGNMISGSADSIADPDFLINSEASDGLTGVCKRDREFGHEASEQLSGSSDRGELADAEAGIEEAEGGEPDQKRRVMEAKVVEPASHRTVTEPRIIVQTTSEVDLLDDGYRWRKYGQKVVKGNPHPRSYYKCTTLGCNVRKHVERASTDPKAVITTYEGKHNHDIPAARNSSHNTSTTAAHSNNAKSHNSISSDPNILRISDPNNNLQRPVTVLQLKGEHEIA